MKEVFKESVRFTDYLISNCGRLKTKARKLRYVHAVTGNEHFRQSQERFLKVQYNDLTGYKFYQPYKEQKLYNAPIHRLVAETFLPRINGKDYINHKDGNKHNNRVDNLEWCTNEYNHEHATKTGLKAKGEQIGSSKLNDNSVHAIKWFLSKGVNHTELGKAFQISRPNISLISEGKAWRHITINNPMK
jgi:hypothetical protein